MSNEIEFRGIGAELLYELETIAPWSSSHDATVDDVNANGGQNVGWKFAARFWGNVALRSLGLGVRLPYDSAPSTLSLRALAIRAVGCRALFQLCVSPCGQFVASIEADSLCVRTTLDNRVVTKRKILALANDNASAATSTTTTSSATTTSTTTTVASLNDNLDNVIINNANSGGDVNNSASLSTISDAKARWRRLVWTRDSLQIVVLGGDGDVLLFSRDGALVARAAALEIGSVDGFSDVATSSSDVECDCLTDSSGTCNELLLLTTDGWLRRIHLPPNRSANSTSNSFNVDDDDASATSTRTKPNSSNNNSADGSELSLHPLVGALPGDRAREACVATAVPLPIHEYQFVSACVAYDESSRLVAVGGGARDSETCSLTLWRLASSASGDNDDAALRPLCVASVSTSADDAGCSQPDRALIGSNWPLVAVARLRALADPTRLALLHCLRFSANGLLLAGADLRGNLFVWRIRDRGQSATLVVMTTASELDAACAAINGVDDDANDDDNNNNTNNNGDEATFVADLVWWSDDALTITRSNGELFVVRLQLATSTAKAGASRVISSVERLRYAAALTVAAANIESQVAPPTFADLFEFVFNLNIVYSQPTIAILQRAKQSRPVMALQREHVPTPSAQHASLVDVPPDRSRIRCTFV